MQNQQIAAEGLHDSSGIIVARCYRDSTGITPVNACYQFLTKASARILHPAGKLPYSNRQTASVMEKGMITQPDSQVLEMMGGTKGVPMDALIRAGVSLVAIDNLSSHGINAVNIGIINARTLRHRRSKGEPLSQEEGDRLYRVSKIVVLAEQVFGTKDKAAHWLNKHQTAFGGLTALEVAATTPGYIAAEETLERIDHGFFA
ncbi:antitoxin Xre/MbcA/ParS toxin-binding domain-containing protein [Pseudomonas sp. NA-150]|uniref:antitoxin Xre/MbcA/ParS toxin-binding domain-containing protein n=1 Tax=Pseudomonas sp. NA-150 TaxID=3367525 RepID=UPI0037C55727